MTFALTAFFTKAVSILPTGKEPIYELFSCIRMAAGKSAIRLPVEVQSSVRSGFQLDNRLFPICNHRYLEAECFADFLELASAEIRKPP